MLPELQQEAPSVVTTSPPRWSLATRIGFRFVFSYFFLYMSPGAVGSLGVDESHRSYQAVSSALWNQIVPWVGTKIFGLKGSFVEVPNGSGDQLYDWVLIFCIAVTALLATAVWSVLDRKRDNYQQLSQWLRLFMRLLLVSTMISYGVSKLLPTQFSEIHMARLVDPLGHLTPMALLWAFMGYSRAYTIFGGIAETLGGLLLIVPRFTSIGALISLGVLSNVLMLNLCYDVPRKIFTIHLVLMCIFLVLPDIRRITNLFFLNRTAEPIEAIPFFKDKQLNRGVLALQYLYGAACLVLAFQVSYASALKKQVSIDPPLRGIWSVEQFSSEDSYPIFNTDENRWRSLIFEAPDYIAIQTFKGPLQLYTLKLEPGQKKLSYAEVGQPVAKATFTLNMPDKDRVLMSGEIDGHEVNAVLRRVDVSDPSEFLLTHRDFRWVTPVPRWR